MTPTLLDTVKQLLVNQFQAALCTLGVCIDRCPDALWDAPVANLKFCQVAFHTLFFADLYLGHDVKSISQQSFHRANPQFFCDYEELEHKPQTQTYDKPGIKDYLQHVRAKATSVIMAETAESLAATPGFEWHKFSRAEMHVYNTRHLQHHAAQLILRLRLDVKGFDIPWIGSGWRDL
jgi:DinB superfamily